MKLHSFPAHAPRRQNGAVLFLALVFLILLTLLALTGMATSVMQERMTGGMRNAQLALMGAETGARTGEAFLWGLVYVIKQPLPVCVGTPTGDCVHQVIPSASRGGGAVLAPAVQSFRTRRDWSATLPAGGRSVPGMTSMSGSSQTASLSQAPQYLIEDIGPDLPPSAGCTGGAIFNCNTGSAGKQVFYRVTSRSQGGSGATLKVVESVYSAADLTNTGTAAGGP